MSQILKTQQYLISTAMGSMQVRNDLVIDFDVEDIVRNRAISMARALQFSNIGQEIDANATLPAIAVPSAFIPTEI